MASGGASAGPVAAPLAAGRLPARVGAALAGAPERIEAMAEAEREQLPLWLPVGLMLGIAAWFWLPDASSWAAFMAFAGAAALGLFAAVGRRRWGRALGIFALTAALGCALVWVRAERVAAPRLDREGVAHFSAEILAVEQLPAREMVRLMLAPREAPELPPRLRVNVDREKASEALRPGAVIRLRAWLMPPAPMAVPGAYDFARAAWFQRIGATGRLLGDIALLQPARDRGWRAAMARWRERLSAHVRASLGGPEGEIAATLATGDRGGISLEDAEAMRRSGLAHLLSISGLHVTAVVGAAMLLALKLLALSPRLALRWPLVLIAAGFGAAAGLGYTLLTGAEVPTVRACAAAMLVLAGIALGREALTLRLIAVGALVVLLLWPESLAGPSFQLSFAAVTAIVALHEHPRIRALLSRRDEGYPRRLGRILLGLLLTGIAVEAALAPIALFHFHQSGLYGALANIVAIPLTTFVIMPFEALGLAFDLLGLGAPFWWVAGQGLRFLLWIARTTAATPGAVALLPTMPAGAYALMLAGGLWLALWRSRWRRWGAAPFAIGALWALTTPAPDLLITGDGRHLAVLGADGDLAILRGRAGDYVRTTLAETSGAEPDFVELEYLPEASCSADLCAFDIRRGGRIWQVLATRTSHHVARPDMDRACAAVDIVVSDRRLPRSCRPRWLKADRALLGRTGGLAITFGSSPRVRSVSDSNGEHHWAVTSPPPVPGRRWRYRSDRQAPLPSGPRPN